MNIVAVATNSWRFSSGNWRLILARALVSKLLTPSRAETSRPGECLTGWRRYV